jgi:hypothetical protein
MRNYAFKRLGGLLLAVAGSHPPLDDEWRAYMEEVATAMVQELGLGSDLITSMVITDGGSPTAPQRAAMAALLRGRGVASAVVSDSTVLRVAITLVGYVNPGIRVFPSRDWLQAAAFVGAGGWPYELLRVATELAAEVGGVQVLAAIQQGTAG